MTESATLTVRLPAGTKANLATLAGKTRRTSSFLAAEAITAYVARELDIIEAIEAGLADIEAGRFSSHADVMRDVWAEIEAVKPKP